MTIRSVRAVGLQKVACALLVSFAGISASNATNYSDFLPCQPLDPKQTYFDLNDPANAVKLGTVESNHFSYQVEHLVRGQTGTIPNDLAFVLRQFPNHHRALNAMATWQLKNKLPDDPDSNVWTADCYFQRAIAFTPDDWVVHFIYGIYLHKAHRLEEAQRAYDVAEVHGATGADYFYNRGLLEVDLGHLDKAEGYAKKAYALGHPLTGLRDKLARARSKQGERAPAKPIQAETQGQSGSR